MPELKSLFGTDHPVALVTGSGSKRVGNVVARALAACGFHLVLHANRSVQEAKETANDVRRAGGQAIALTADLTNESAARKLVDDAHQHFGRLDVLVNCAAIWRPVPLEKVTADEVRRNFEINTLATFLCSQQAGLIMAAQPTGGVIINIGDWAVARPYLNYAAYFPSKGAIPALTRDLAVELAARNPRVRVNAILPGPVMLPPDLPQTERDNSIAGTLVKREGLPENIAHAVLFLIENDFVTGVTLPVDGGRTIAS
ncbi:MAG: SDR family NAD(P)-dependent oxidoreductase [Pirellulaceae bacterium]